MDVAAEADDVAEAQFAQEGEQLLIAEAAIGQDRDPAAGGHEFGQAPQAGILEVVALVLQFVLPDAQPQQRRRAAMAGDQAQRQRGLVVVVEIGPVHRHQDVPALADLVRHPAGETVPHVDAVVAQQPVHLLDRVLGHQAPRLGQRLADHRHRQRCGRHHAQRGAGQGVDPLGMQVSAIHPAQERSGHPPIAPAADPPAAIVPLQLVTRWNVYGVASN